MDFNPALPEHNDNVSHDKPVREFILLACGITFFLLAAFWVLGLFVDMAVDRISPGMEAAIFSSVSTPGPAAVAAQDPRREKLQSMVDALRQCGGVTYPLQVSLIDSDEANAMAFPGGKILVLEGLLDMVESENGLTFVLAHEIAHFKNRDHLRGLGRAIVLTVAAALLTGAESDFTRLVAPTATFSQAHYSQDREEMADNHALLTLNCYYGHVGGATEFFKAMEARDEDMLAGFGHYFSTHPEARERIDNLYKLTEERHFAILDVLPMPDVFDAFRPIETTCP
jgi:Zn-dependent protease with chaperone function